MITMMVLTLHYLLVTRGISGQSILYLWVFLLCFCYADRCVAWGVKPRGWWPIAMVTVALAIVIALFCQGLYDTIRPLAEVLGVLSAGLVFLLVLMLTRKAKANKVVAFVAGISFEIYLMHHNFSFGRYSIPAYMGNPIAGFVALVCFSVLSAWMLNRLCNLLYKCMGKC